jgi:hypothetical protein
MKSFLTVLCIGIIFFYSCSSVQTSIQGIEKFNQLKTFNWAPSSKDSSGQKFTRSVRGQTTVELNLNKTFLERELQKKGFKAESSKPDFLIRYRAYLEKEDNSSNLDWTRPGTVSNPPGWGSRIENSTGISMIPEKTTIVIIELLDPTSGEVIWRGIKSSVVGEVMNLTETLERDVRAVVKKIPK